MTALRAAAIGRDAPAIVVVAAGIGFAAAAIILVTAASSMAMAWPPVPAWSSCSLWECVGEALNNVVSIPGLVFSVVTTGTTVGGLVFGGGGEPPIPPGTTTYIPGVTEDPTAGDVVYIPDVGVGTVTEAHSTVSRQPGGGGTSTSRVTVETESGTLTIEQNFTLTPPTPTPGL